LRAVETSKVQARDQSEAALLQARMRADLLHATTQKDQALGDGHETKRRLALVEEDLRQTKSKLSKMTQEKIQLERDQRATLSLAKSLQGNVHSDVDYYKRKVCMCLVVVKSFGSEVLVSHV
jgi:ABC-type Fe3+-citrate transport system substrate-binding protein